MQRFVKMAAALFLTGFLSAGTLEIEVTKLADLQRIQNLLHVPDSLAHVIDASDDRPLDTVPEYILVQDVHRQPQVQAKIASLIEYGYGQWGVRKVFLEGAFTALDLSVFHRVPNKTRMLLMDDLVKNGNLSGPELAAVHILEKEWSNPPVSPFQIFGMEDPELYRKNVQAYQAVIAHRDRALQQLTTIRRLEGSMNLPDSNPMNEQLDRTEALLHLRLTPIDYAAYLKEKAAVPSTPIIDPAIHAAEEFYRLAQLRSQMFLKQVSCRVPASDAPRILVMGGFHTAYMADCLRHEGHSFIVLAPMVGPMEEDPLYEKRLKETAEILAQAIRPAAR
jgi:hypothetical protein